MAGPVLCGTCSQINLADAFSSVWVDDLRQTPARARGRFVAYIGSIVIDCPLCQLWDALLPFAGNTYGGMGRKGGRKPHLSHLKLLQDYSRIHSYSLGGQSLDGVVLGLFKVASESITPLLQCSTHRDWGYIYHSPKTLLASF